MHGLPECVDVFHAPALREAWNVGRCDEYGFAAFLVHSGIGCVLGDLAEPEATVQVSLWLEVARCERLHRVRGLRHGEHGRDERRLTLRCDEFRLLGVGLLGVTFVAVFAFVLVGLRVSVSGWANRVAEISGALLALGAFRLTSGRDLLCGLDLLAERCQLVKCFFRETLAVAELLIEGFAQLRKKSGQLGVVHLRQPSIQLVCVLWQVEPASTVLRHFIPLVFG